MPSGYHGHRRGGGASSQPMPGTAAGEYLQLLIVIVTFQIISHSFYNLFSITSISSGNHFIFQAEAEEVVDLDVGEDESRDCPDKIFFGTTIYQTTKKWSTSVVRLSWTCSLPEFRNEYKSKG